MRVLVKGRPKTPISELFEEFHKGVWRLKLDLPEETAKKLAEELKAKDFIGEFELL